MSSEAEKLLNDLQRLVEEFEASLKSAAADCAGEAGERIRAGLALVRKRIVGLEKEALGGLRRGADSIDDVVRDNPWRSVGIVAAAAFLVGALVSRRD